MDRSNNLNISLLRLHKTVIHWVVKQFKPQMWLLRWDCLYPQPLQLTDCARQSRRLRTPEYRPTASPRQWKQCRRWRHLLDSAAPRQMSDFRPCCPPVSVSLRWRNYGAVRRRKSTDPHQPSTSTNINNSHTEQFLWYLAPREKLRGQSVPLSSILPVNRLNDFPVSQPTVSKHGSKMTKMLKWSTAFCKLEIQQKYSD